MIAITIKENESIDKALKRFKKKFEKAGVLRELRSRTYFEKKSVRRRNEMIRAAYIQSLHANDENA
jgi:small subunit ribosomal protein S21